MHAVLLGASRGVAHYALLALLAKGWEATVLLRSGAFPAKAQPALEPYAGKVTIVKGDASSEEDVKKLFIKHVDVVITSIARTQALTSGGTPSLSLRGFVLDQPVVCARSGLVLVCVLAELRISPRVVAVSSMGIGDSHGAMPLAMRILYPLAISAPHADKEGLEYMCPRDTLREVVIVRPAFFTDGEALGPDNTKADEKLRTYTISRKEIGRWIADEAVQGDKWANKRPIVGY
ncbi:hypothetical protein Q5752_001627 [Cryptotrichosporon argae]